MNKWLRLKLNRSRSALATAFRSLKHRNYRYYFCGQMVSMTGAQLQALAINWLTYTITQSAWMLGISALCTFLPTMLLSIPGGIIADKHDRRGVLLITQAIGLAVALLLAVLCYRHALTIPVLIAFSILQGALTAFEMPCRQALVYDIVSREDLINAVSLGSFAFNTSRLIGPSIGAFLIASYGTFLCFIANAFSYGTALYTLSRLPSSKKQETQTAGTKNSPREAARFLFTTRSTCLAVLLVGTTSCFAFQYGIMLPVIALTVLNCDISAVGTLTSSAALGSLLGNLLLAAKSLDSSLTKTIGWSSLTVGITLLLFALSNSLPAMLLCLFFLGFSIANLLGSCNTTIQLAAPDHLRGKIMSIYGMVVFGTVPLGSLIIGYLSDTWGVQRAFMAASFVCLAAAAVFQLHKIVKT